MSLILKKTKFQTFYYINIIPTNKGANSYKLIISKIWFLYSARSIQFDDSGISYGQATIKQQ